MFIKPRCVIGLFALISSIQVYAETCKSQYYDSTGFASVTLHRQMRGNVGHAECTYYMDLNDDGPFLNAYSLAGDYIPVSGDWSNHYPYTCTGRAETCVFRKVNE